MTITLAEPNGEADKNISYVFDNYKGYVKFTGWFDNGYYGTGKILVDGIELPQSSTFATNNGGISEFSFEGYIQENITIIGRAAFSDSTVYFSEFTTNSINTSLSKTTQDFYHNIPEEETWGELIIDIPFKDSTIINEETSYLEGNLLWYNPLNDVSTQQMKCLELDLLQDGPLHEYITTYISSYQVPSGYKNLCAWGGDNLPILIHIDDIGKKNTIGPLLREDGSEFYINLIII